MSGPLRRDGAEAGGGRWTFVHFCLSSGMAFLIDNAVFLLFCSRIVPWLAPEGWTRAETVFASLVPARLVSSNFNYFYNRIFVFRSSAPARSYFAYWALVLLVAALAYAGVVGTARLLDLRGGPALTACKIAVEGVLFVLSYHVQRRGIFARRRAADGGGKEIA